MARINTYLKRMGSSGCYTLEIGVAMKLRQERQSSFGNMK